MTKHNEFEILIQKCLDREITEDENITLQLHLSQCPDCSKLYNELTSVETSINELDQLAPNHDFNNRVLRAISIKKVRAWIKVAAVLGSAWFVTILSLILSSLSSDVFSRILTSSPAIVRFLKSVQFVTSTLTRVFSPLAKSQFNPTVFIVGAILSLGMFLIFGKLLNKKETICVA